jgi:sodium-dependent dicarboxylate transporter 2/3/5
MEWVGAHLLPGPGTSPVVSLLIITAMATLFTTFLANAAVIALMLPAVLLACPELGLDPRAMTIVMAVATGVSFALPVSTPAMAMAYGTGYIGTREGVGFGTIMSLMAIPVVILVVVFVWPLLGLSPFLDVVLP